MYQDCCHDDNDNDDNDDHENRFYLDKIETTSTHFNQPPSTNIDIPSSKNLFYNQMSPQYQEFYNDILSFTSDSSLLDAYPVNHHNNTSSAQDIVVDPMNDPQFMAFLSSLSTSEPTSRPSLGAPVLMLPELDAPRIATLQVKEEQEQGSHGFKKKKINTKQIKTIKKRTCKSNTKLGQCEHPKHSLYRQEKYILSTQGTASVDEASTTTSTTTHAATTAASAAGTSIQSIPRRGRPPKGSKSTEFLYSTSPLTTFADDDLVAEAANAASPYYPMVELTVRPLPKRLEAVVGKTNIKVCLTCLKRSDMDPAYLQDAAYVGPQTLLKRKKL